MTSQQKSQYRLTWLAIAMAGLAGSAIAEQAAVPASGAVAATSASAPNERAKRDAAKVFQFILVNSDKGRRSRQADTPTPAAAPAVAVAAVAKPAPAPSAVRVAEAAAKAKADAAVVAAATPVINLEPTSAGMVAGAAATVASALPSVPVAPPVTPPEPTVEEDDPLVLLTQVEPQFPPNVMELLGKGKVQVRFDVRRDGSVASTEVVSTTSKRLNNAALAAVAAWRFKAMNQPQTAIVELGFEMD